jgi:hypothetical protein
VRKGEGEEGRTCATREERFGPGRRAGSAAEQEGEGVALGRAGAHACCEGGAHRRRAAVALRGGLRGRWGGGAGRACPSEVVCSELVMSLICAQARGLTRAERFDQGGAV